jgi:hypothetical protein
MLRPWGVRALRQVRDHASTTLTLAPAGPPVCDVQRHQVLLGSVLPVAANTRPAPQHSHPTIINQLRKKAIPGQATRERCG